MTPVVFDLDGTLIHSAPDIHDAANNVLSELELEPLSLEAVTSFIGNGVPKLIERVMRARNVDPSKHAELVLEFHRFYDPNPTRLTRPYPGVVETLEALRKQRIPLGLCTNKPTAPTIGILRALDLEKYFDVLVCGDTLDVRKPDPAPLRQAFAQMGAKTGIYVGDSEIDAETADRADVTFLLFEGGYRKSAIVDLVYSASFSDFGQVPELVEARSHPEMAKA